MNSLDFYIEKGRKEGFEKGFKEGFEKEIKKYKEQVVKTCYPIRILPLPK